MTKADDLALSQSSEVHHLPDLGKNIQIYPTVPPVTKRFQNLVLSSYLSKFY